MTFSDKCKIPNFFVVGAEKAGTTSLYHYLRQHPQIFLPSIKEPNFFCKDMVPSSTKKFAVKNNEFVHRVSIKNLNDYLKLFMDVKDEIAIGEASVSYLFSKVAAEEIKNFNPNSKIIIVLRNPVLRAYSEYKMDLTIGRVTQNFLFSFKQNGKYKEKSLYYNQVKKYIDLFPVENLLIILFEDMKVNLPGTTKMIFEFLNVDRAFIPDLGNRYNQSLTPKMKSLNFILFSSGLKRVLSRLTPEKPKELFKSYFYKKEANRLSKHEFDILIPVFYDDILKLEKLIGKDLSFWQSHTD